MGWRGTERLSGFAIANTLKPLVRPISLFRRWPVDSGGELDSKLGIASASRIQFNLWVLSVHNTADEINVLQGAFSSEVDGF